ncbi:MAG: hypothetical protein KDB18_12825 [Salinibacterium sp.]|nr:hypothetical protein [Salinibacterium sp.]
MSPLQGLTYLVMPCAFRCGDQSRGPGRFGDFDGLAEGIDYLDSLGVKTIVTTPPFESVAYHGYQHGPPTSISRRLGGERAFRRFVDSAHEAGMRVLVDFVAYGVDPRALSDIERVDLAWENASRTRATGYTARTWNSARVRFAHWNLRSRSARERVIEWAQQWMDPQREGSVDGLRLDHVWEQYPSDGRRRRDGLAPGSPAWAGGWGYDLDGFWAEFVERVRDIRPDATLIAEPAEWHLSGQSLLRKFDAALSKPLLFGLRDAVLRREPGAWPQTTRLAQDGLLACSGDHDTDRLSSAVGVGPHRAALALLLLGVRTPVVYSGDELGVTGRRLHRLGGDAGDLGRRGPMRWRAIGGWPDPDHARACPRAAAYLDIERRRLASVEEQDADAASTLSLVRRLSQERARHPAIASGAREPIPAPSGVWAHRCTAEGSTVEVWVNLGAERIEGKANQPELGPWEARVTSRRHEVELPSAG